MVRSYRGDGYRQGSHILYLSQIMIIIIIIMIWILLLVVIKAMTLYNNLSDRLHFADVNKLIQELQFVMPGGCCLVIRI